VNDAKFFLICCIVLTVYEETWSTRELFSGQSVKRFIDFVELIFVLVGALESLQFKGRSENVVLRCP
jgi:hypothetical protein